MLGFKEWTLAKLDKTFAIKQARTDPVLEHWLNGRADLSDFDRQALLKLQENLILIRSHAPAWECIPPLFDSFPRSCVGMHTSPLSLFSGLSEGDWDLLIKAREAENGLIRSAETPSEIRMHSHAGAWEREKRIIRSAETPSEIRMHSHAGAWEREKNPGVA